MKISEIASVGNYDPSAIYLHGTKQQLEGNGLKRFGKHGSDMGALFFCKDTPGGRWYAGTYGEDIHLCRLRPSFDQIFDLTNRRHRALLQKSIHPQQFSSMIGSSRNGHLDWTEVDDELFSDLGFRGVIFLERPKGMVTGMPEQSGMAILPEDVLSVGIFNAEDVDLVGTATREQLWQEAGII